MINKLKPKSEFSHNVLTLMTGTTIAQAIPIAISPILTRIYTPEDFGVFALFMAITSIFGSIANGRYELAIMLPKKDEDAINILALGFIINIILTFLLLVIVLIFHESIVALLNNKDISIWLYFIPFSVLLIGCFNLLNYFNNRKKLYRDLAKANVYKSIATVVVQLSFGLLKAGAFGLVSGQLTSQIVSNTKLFFNIKNLNLFSKISRVKIIAQGKRYKDFPKFSMWAFLANTLSLNLINIFVSSIYNIKTLGFYSLTQKLLSMPLSLIGSSIGQVLFQESTKEKQSTGKAINSFNSTVKKLFLITVPSFGILFFLVEDLFAFVFGEEWRIAGKYAQIIMPLFAVRFIIAPITLIAIVFEKIKIDLFFQFGLLFLYVFVFYLSYVESFSFEELLYAINYLVGTYYLLYFLLLKKISQGATK